MGLKLAERGGKAGKKRAIIAMARKLVVLLHRLWSAEALSASITWERIASRRKTGLLIRVCYRQLLVWTHRNAYGAIFQTTPHAVQ